MQSLVLGLVLVMPVGYSLSTKRRRMSNRIENEIKKANAFGDQIENLVIAKGQCPQVSSFQRVTCHKNF
jgi:hypothetical protein